MTSCASRDLPLRRLQVAEHADLVVVPLGTRGLAIGVPIADLGEWQRQRPSSSGKRPQRSVIGANPCESNTVAPPPSIIRASLMRPAENAATQPFSASSHCSRPLAVKPRAWSTNSQSSARRIRGHSAGTRRPPRATDPAPMPVPSRAAVSWRPFGPHAAGDVVLHHRRQHRQPAPTASASRPSRSSPASSPSATLTRSGTAGQLVSISLVLVGLAHGGPLPRGVLGGSPDAYREAGFRRGTATSSSTSSGTTSSSHAQLTRPAARYFVLGSSAGLT